MFWGICRFIILPHCLLGNVRTVSGPVFPNSSVGNRGFIFRGWMACMQPHFGSLLQSLHLLAEAFLQCLGDKAVAVLVPSNVSVHCLLSCSVWVVTLRGRGVWRPSITFPQNTDSVLPSRGWANSKGYQRLSNLPQRNRIFTIHVLYLLSSKNWPWIPNSCAILAFLFPEWRNHC